MAGDIGPCPLLLTLLFVRDAVVGFCRKLLIETYATLVHLCVVFCALAGLLATTSGCMVEREAGYRAYRAYLESQETSPQTIPSELIEKIQGSYAMPIEDVRFFTHMDTVSGNVVTMGKKIYFPRRMLFTQAEHVRRLLHELRHVEQYSRDGDLFFQRYSVAAVSASLNQMGEGLGRGVVDTHANFSYETDAKAAEAEVFMKIKPLLCDDKVCPGLR